MSDKGDDSSGSSSSSSGSSSAASQSDESSNSGNLAVIRKESEEKAKAIRKSSEAKRRRDGASVKKRKNSASQKDTKSRAQNGVKHEENGTASKKRRTTGVRRPPPPLELRDPLSKKLAPRVLAAMHAKTNAVAPSVATMQAIVDALAGVTMDLLDDCTLFIPKDHSGGRKICMRTAFSAVRDRLGDQEMILTTFEAMSDIAAVKGTKTVAEESFQKLALHFESQ